MGASRHQVIQGERQFDLVVRMQEQFRNNEDASAICSSPRPTASTCH